MIDWKQHVRTALRGDHPRLGRSIALALQALILLSVVSIGVETLPNLPGWADAALESCELKIVVAFTAEYLARLLVAERPISYAISFWGIVDLAAILPYYLGSGVDLRAGRAIRLIRLFRLLKLARYSMAVERIGSALRNVRDELIVFGMTTLILFYLCGVCIYYFEHKAQPDVFASVFHAMWWAAITLTTVGYGDMYPVTAGGRVFTVLILLLALGIIAVPTGLIASALSRLRDDQTGRD